MAQPRAAEAVSRSAHLGQTDAANPRPLTQTECRSVRRKLGVLRAQMDLTQAELANILGVSRGTVAHVERGRLKPSCEFLTRLNVFVRGAFRLVEDQVDARYARVDALRRDRRTAEALPPSRAASWMEAKLERDLASTPLPTKTRGTWEETARWVRLAEELHHLRSLPSLKAKYWVTLKLLQQMHHVICEIADLNRTLSACEEALKREVRS